ncbi:MAG TPA: hypothetical protein PLI90_08290 [Rhodocyclaceae bacterium]|mgnify:CR=1 FL=1|nr:hypothetical protein [Rhodocyclaceae bacterium]
MVKKPTETREFTNAGVSSTRSMRDAMGDTDNYRTQQRTLGTGNNVTLRTKGGEPQVIGEQEDELYLDNGFVEPGFFGTSTTVTQAQHIATDHNPDTDAAYLSVKTVLKPPFTPMVFKPLFKSFSTKGSEAAAPKPEKIDALKSKNAAAIMCPPAMFTGMMRRYVSALYGKKVADAHARELTVIDVGVYAKLSYDGMIYDPGQTTTGIVYSAIHKKYWMVNLGGSSMSYQELKFSEIGLEVLAKIKPLNTPANNNILHTYALSEARVLRNGSDQVDWRDGGSFTTVGIPLNFGWRFNSDGQKFTAVAIDQYSDYVTESRLYIGTIAITEDMNADAASPLRYRLTASVVASESVLGWQSNAIRVFKPIAPADYMWVRTGPVDLAVTNAPLLSFYDDADALQVCRYSRDPGEPEYKKEIELTGKWAPSSSNTFQVPSGYTVPSACGPVAEDTAMSTYGQGESGYIVTDVLVGDKATSSLGSLSGTETRFSYKTQFNCDLNSVVIDYQLVASDQVYIGATTPVPADPEEINGTAICGQQYLPGGAGINYYNRYYRYMAGDGTGKNWSTGSAKTISMVFIAPQDCATAWYEASFSGEQTGVIQNTTFHAESQPCSQKFTGVGFTYLCEYGVNWGMPIDAAQTDAVDEGVTIIKCRTGHGLLNVATISGDSVPKAYKFFGVTESAPVVNAAVVTYEDQLSSSAATNLDTETLVKLGWPATGIRPIGWQ